MSKNEKLGPVQHMKDLNSIVQRALAPAILPVFMQMPDDIRRTVIQWDRWSTPRSANLAEWLTWFGDNSSPVSEDAGDKCVTAILYSSSDEGVIVIMVDVTAQVPALGRPPRHVRQVAFGSREELSKLKRAIIDQSTITLSHVISRTLLASLVGQATEITRSISVPVPDPEPIKVPVPPPDPPTPGWPAELESKVSQWLKEFATAGTAPDDLWSDSAHGAA